MDREANIQLAIEALRGRSDLGVREAAYMFNIPRTTLRSRLAGSQSRQKANEIYQRLTPAEEAAVVKAVLQMSVWGWPLTIKALEAFAGHYLRTKGDSEPLGGLWYRNFLRRHPELQLKKAHNLDQQPRDRTSLPSLNRWFETYQRICATYGVTAEDTYNMDEKGVMKGIADVDNVVISRSEKTTITTQPGNRREWVSIIECIGTNGYVLPPFVIFEGKQLPQSWITPGLDPNTVIKVTPNGWTDHEVALEWLQHFDRHTKGRNRGKYRLLILDGHSSYQTFEFVEYCENNAIIPLCLPPHATHVLQPLDVGIFSPLAEAYKQLISEQSLLGATRVTNPQFLQLYQKARQTIAQNIPGAWQGAGLLPYNPEKVLAEYKPKAAPFKAVTVVPDTAVTTVNQVAQALLTACPSPLRKNVEFLHQACISALADNQALKARNEGFVRKAREARSKQANQRQSLRRSQAP